MCIQTPIAAQAPVCTRAASDPGVTSPRMPGGLFADGAVARSRRQAHALGADAQSRWAIFTGLCGAQKILTPYVFAEVHFARVGPGPGPALARIDGAAWAQALRRHPHADFTTLQEQLYCRPWQRYRLCLILPWQAEHRPLSWVDDAASYARAQAYEPQLLAMAKIAPTDPRRGTLCGLFSGGAPLPPDPRIAPYLLGAMNDGQRRIALDYALGRAASRGHPALVAALLQLGVNPAPPDFADELLPLTRATLHGNVDCIALLLAAGADPRQAASPLHLTAAACARVQPQVAELFAPWQRVAEQVLLPMRGLWQLAHLGD